MEATRPGFLTIWVIVVFRHWDFHLVWQDMLEMSLDNYSYVVQHTQCEHLPCSYAVNLSA